MRPEIPRSSVESGFLAAMCTESRTGSRALRLRPFAGAARELVRAMSSLMSIGRVTTAALLLVSGGCLAAGADSKLALEINPASVAASDLRESRVQVVLNNSGTSTLSDLRLSVFTNAGVAVRVEPAEQTAVPPSGAAVWMVFLKRNDQAPLPGMVHFTATFTAKPEGGRAVGQVAIGAVTVTRADAEPIEQIVKADIKTALASLTDYRDGYVYLAVSNLSGSELQLKDVTVFCPKFVSFTLGQETRTCDTGAATFNVARQIGPRQVETLAFVVRASGAIQAGKHLLLFKTNVQWNSAGMPQSASVVSSQEVAIGVLAESELLTALGVPTFLVLPGFLILTFVGVLRSWGWKLVSPGGNEIKFPPEGKTPEFWFLAVTLSIVAAGLFSLLHQRSYLEGYSLNDVVRVWLESMVAAFLIYGACVGGNRWWIRRLAEQVAPQAGDTPETILQKIANRGETLARPTYQWTHEGQQFLVYGVDKPAPGAATQWVAPAILVRWNTSARPEMQQFVYQAARTDKDPNGLARALAQARVEHAADIGWKPLDGLHGPAPVATSALTFAQNEEVPLEEETQE